MADDTWDCAKDQVTYWNEEWKSRTFTFLGGLNDDEYVNVRSQMFNNEKLNSIEEVYSNI